MTKEKIFYFGRCWRLQSRAEGIDCYFQWLLVVNLQPLIAAGGYVHVEVLYKGVWKRVSQTA